MLTPKPFNHDTPSNISLTDSRKVDKQVLNARDNRTGSFPHRPHSVRIHIAALVGGVY